jgi:hypothetical protein
VGERFRSCPLREREYSPYLLAVADAPNAPLAGDCFDDMQPSTMVIARVRLEGGRDARGVVDDSDTHFPLVEGNLELDPATTSTNGVGHEFACDERSVLE